jgi:acyl-CoA thioester hydrolase
MKWVKSDEIPVRYVECDPMGIVHHSNYLSWFEIGRVEYAKQARINFCKTTEQIYLPVVDIQCKIPLPE